MRIYRETFSIYGSDYCINSKSGERLAGFGGASSNDTAIGGFYIITKYAANYPSPMCGAVHGQKMSTRTPGAH